MKTRKAGFWLAAASSAVVRTASRSKARGRQGISSKSAALHASRAMMSACGGVSIIAKSAPRSAACLSFFGKRACAAQSITSGSASPRQACQVQAVAWGSVSNTRATNPAALAAVAKWIASVVLPVPPFWLITAIILMITRSHVYVLTYKQNNTQAEAGEGQFGGPLSGSAARRLHTARKSVLYSGRKARARKSAR